MSRVAEIDLELSPTALEVISKVLEEKKTSLQDFVSTTIRNSALLFTKCPGSILNLKLSLKFLI